MPTSRKAIIWTNTGPVHRRIYAALGRDEVINMDLEKSLLFLLVVSCRCYLPIAVEVAYPQRRFITLWAIGRFAVVGCIRLDWIMIHCWITFFYRFLWFLHDSGSVYIFSFSAGMHHGKNWKQRAIKYLGGRNVRFPSIYDIIQNTLTHNEQSCNRFAGNGHVENWYPFKVTNFLLYPVCFTSINFIRHLSSMID